MEFKEEDIDLCQKAFMDLDEEDIGAIHSNELKSALEKIGISIDENELYKLISEVDDKNTGMIKFADFLTIYAKYKDGDDNDDEDMIDAYVAMGGDEDLGGYVDSNRLI